MIEITSSLLYLFWIIVGSAAYAGVSAAPWVPTKPKQKRKLMKHVELKDNAHVYDLGCGTGTLLFASKKKNPTIKATGFEISVLPYLIAKLKTWLRPKQYKNISIQFGNLFNQDISNADVIFVFLLSKSYPKLKAKFAKELKDDCIVIVEAWPLLPVPNGQKIDEDGLLPVYIYKGYELK